MISYLLASVFLFITTVLLLVGSSSSTAFHLPGAGPKNFAEGEKMEIHANVLTSVMTHLPYDFYSLPICKPKQKQGNLIKKLS